VRESSRLLSRQSLRWLPRGGGGGSVQRVYVELFLSLSHSAEELWSHEFAPMKMA
jgi:hypothetical protein